MGSMTSVELERKMCRFIINLCMETMTKFSLRLDLPVDSFLVMKQEYPRERQVKLFRYGLPFSCYPSLNRHKRFRIFLEVSKEKEERIKLLKMNFYSPKDCSAISMCIDSQP